LSFRICRAGFTESAASYRFQYIGLRRVLFHHSSLRDKGLVRPQLSTFHSQLSAVPQVPQNEHLYKKAGVAHHYCPCEFLFARPDTQ
jgi:hypothetical protein